MVRLDRVWKGGGGGGVAAHGEEAISRLISADESRRTGEDGAETRNR